MIRSDWLRRVLSRDNLSRDVRTAAVALLVSVSVVATPSVAAKIKNADTVDGKHAVGASAPIAKRKGKLVATDNKGRLPNNIIRKARDADRLDGRNSTAFTLRNAKPGTVQTGLWSAWGGPSGGYVADSVTLASRLSANIPITRVTYLEYGDPMTVECPGIGLVAAAGWACLYELNAGGQSLGNIFSQSEVFGGPSGVSREGFGIYYNCSSDACYAYGRWAIRAPTPGMARTPARTARQSNP